MPIKRQQNTNSTTSPKWERAEKLDRFRRTGKDPLHSTLALIMAGGRGKRLAPLTDNLCKPAVPFGGNFKIIDFTLSNCVNSGIRHIGVLTQFKAHALISHLQNGWNSFNRELNEYIELLPAQQQTGAHWYQGTADAVYQNLFTVRNHKPERVLILAGDHIYKADYQRMIQYHIDSGADLTIGCAEVPLNRANEFGILGIDHTNRVVSFTEKPASLRRLPHIGDTALASMGIYVFSTDFLCAQLEKDASLAESSHDFGKDIIPRCISDYRIQAYPYTRTQADNYWKDVGTLDAYYQANMDLLEDSPQLDLYDDDWPIWGYQAQLPPSRITFADDNQAQMTQNSLIGGGCIISGANVRCSVLFSSVTVHNRSRIDKSLLLPGTTVGKRCLIQNAIIEAGTQIPDGMRIGENMKRDRSRFHVTKNGVVVVNQQMLDINLSNAIAGTRTNSEQPNDTSASEHRAEKHTSTEATSQQD